MAEIRLGAEVGLKNVSREPIKTLKPTEDPAQLPGSDYTNREIEQTRQAQEATRPSQTKGRFQLLGNTINIQA